MTIINDNWPDRFWDWSTTSGLRIAAIVLGAAVFYFIFLIVSRRLLHLARKVGEKSDRVTKEQEMRARTLAGIIRGLVFTVTIIIVALMVLNELGFNVAPLIAGAGIAGVALGFGAQTLVRDLIGGFFILLEGQFYVDDIIQVGTIKGRVEAIKLRTTLIRDGEGVLHIVPNGEMRVVSNLTKGWSRVVLDFDIDYREDIDRVQGVMETALAETHELPEAMYIIDGPSVLGVEKMEGVCVTMRVVAQTAPFRDDEVARALRKLIVKALAANKISVGPESA